jgi:hypothetical protein
MRSPFLLVATCLACGAKADNTARAPGASPTTLASGMALNYNDQPGTVPRSAISDAVFAAVSEEATRQHIAAPVPDARLSRACAALAAVVPTDGIIEYRAVEFALQTNGIVEPSPYVLVVWGSLEDPRLIVDQLRPRFELIAEAGNARVGVGASLRSPGGIGAVVFAIQTVTLQTSPIPRSIAAGGSVHLEARLAPGLSDPVVTVLRPIGDVEQVTLLWPSTDTFGAQLECRSTIGRLQIQVVAKGGDGNRSLAVFPVWCGEEPPRQLSLDAQSKTAVPTDPREAERQLLELVNAERARAGRSALIWDETLADAARAHSQEMRRTGVVAFVVPRAPSFGERVDALGPDARARIRGTVARSYSIAETHHGLIDQPSTRAFLMAAKATHIGIGVVYGAETVPGARELFVSELVRAGPR